MTIRNGRSGASWIGIIVLGLIACGGTRADDLPMVYRGPGAPSAEFDSPNKVKVLDGGEVIEITGSFTYNLTKSFVAALGQAPLVRTIAFDSPGGLVQPAIEIARIIQQRGLDTYVGHLCASACTLAFLGGHQRLLASNARLGFHQAHAPNHRPEEADPLVRQAFARSGVPTAFIDHVLRTPPEAIWYPGSLELREAGIVTGEPSRALMEADHGAALAYLETVKLLRWASPAGVLRFAGAWSDLLGQLQQADPELCWGYLHQVPIDLGRHVGRETLDRMGAALRQVRDDVEHSPSVGIDPAEKNRVMQVLFQSMPEATQRLTLEAMRPNADHRTFCPAVRTLVQAAIVLPVQDSDPALRAILATR